MTAKINERSTVTIGLLITIVGGVVWLTTLYVRAETQDTRINKFEVKIESMEKQFYESNLMMANKLGRIEVLLEQQGEKHGRK